MINILPTEGRTIARSSYVLRLIATATFGGAFIALCCAGLLFPSYIETRTEAEASRAEAARLAALHAGEDTDAPLALARTEIQQFGPTALEETPSSVIQPLLAVRESGVLLSQIQYDAGAGRVMLSGVAGTREKLLSFAQSLRKIAGVRSVDLPVNDLAKNENAHFSLTILIGDETSAPPVVHTEETP